MIPLHPDQWPGTVVHLSDKDEFAIDTCVMFGLSSVPGTFGRVADAGVEIFRAKGLGPLTKWVDDHLWIRILRKWLAKANDTRKRLKQRVKDAGGVRHVKGRLLYVGDSLPDGHAEEFDDDFTFPLTDHSFASPRSHEDALYTYNFDDIDAISQCLGYMWELPKDIAFCFTPIYFGFEWNLPDMVVAVPLTKREKYLNSVEEWEAQSSHDYEETSSLYGKLLHVSFVLTAGRAYLIEFEKLMGTLSKASPFSRHRPPKNLPNDLTWWKEHLKSPISRPIPGPAELVDLHAYSNTSGGIGIGICVCGFWRAYRLLPGWQGNNERDIGWAEAAAFWLLVLIIAERGKPGHHYKIYGDNEGVVEGWWNGRSKNRPTNSIFKRIHCIVEEYQFYIHTRYVPSAQNPADAPS
ncbi:reverse transcriptase ribonuclease h [Moniliophthora roreri MCA 2997]|uniref:Reverse transcriptase ribonuclease h n=2 Tax=Moniliophthora roreri TaxID=221103 RepID=V2WIF7_MONRO|nr:reverse transcriptase ribonuclease h [Moniliophthora roreri MCA 2997]